MRKRKYRTLDGDTVELDVPETDEEREAIRRRIQSGEIDARHSFSEVLEDGDAQAD